MQNLPQYVQRAIDAAEHRAEHGVTTPQEELVELLERFPILLSRDFFPPGANNPLCVLHLIKAGRTELLPRVRRMRREAKRSGPF